MVKMGLVDIGTVIEHVRHIADARADGDGSTPRLESALREVAQVEAWLAGQKAAITSKLAAQVSFPEKSIVECTRGSTRDAINDRDYERAYWFWMEGQSGQQPNGAPSTSSSRFRQQRNHR